MFKSMSSRDRRCLRRGRARRDPGHILAGLATAAFGVVLCARPGIGAVTLALLFGLFNLIAGTWMLAQGIELRRTPTRLTARWSAAPARHWTAASSGSSSSMRPAISSTLSGEPGTRRGWR
jgi:Short repeat of unknown function (DUF308)